MASADLPIEEPVIFVDGGSNRREHGTGLAVGDGDSSSGTMDILLEADKDFSDLAFALSLIPDHFTELVIYGFLGGRRDHELINFGEVLSFLKRRQMPTKAVFDDAAVALGSGSWRLRIDGIFSLVSVETTLVRLVGDCRYEIEPAGNVPPLSSLGLSNVGSGSVSIDNAGPILIVSESISTVTP